MKDINQERQIALLKLILKEIISLSNNFSQTIKFALAIIACMGSVVLSAFGKNFSALILLSIGVGGLIITEIGAYKLKKIRKQINETIDRF